MKMLAQTSNYGSTNDIARIKSHHVLNWHVSMYRSTNICSPSLYIDIGASFLLLS